MSGERLSFGGVADRYDRARPSYPRDAAEWLIGPRPAKVLELGAGTGKLTETLVGLGHDVLATDPDERMLHHLAVRAPRAHACVGTAERIPARSRSVDAVVAAQAFHWFDHPVAVPEIARVLRPGGVLGMVWNERDESIPWVRKLGRLIGNQDQQNDPVHQLRADLHFSFIDERPFRHWQTINREGLLDLVASRSNIAIMPEDERAERLDQVSALYDDYGRGHDGMQLPYVARCYRTVVQQQDPEPPENPTQPDAPQDEPAPEDPGTLLIDFH
ncbi:MAG: class I SAM-dependent methyltransferase [Marmoricola sp.]